MTTEVAAAFQYIAPIFNVQEHGRCSDHVLVVKESNFTAAVQGFSRVFRQVFSRQRHPAPVLVLMDQIVDLGLLSTYGRPAPRHYHNQEPEAEAHSWQMARLITTALSKSMVQFQQPSLTTSSPLESTVL